MGTRIQSETYFLRHCSRNVSPNISPAQWLSYQDGKVPENIQHEESCSPWQGLMDKYSGTNKAKARDTLLEHEVTFRHQVRELHRLYRRQRELTNEIQDNRLYKLQNKTGSSQPVISPTYTSGKTGNAKRTQDGSHFLSSDFMFGRLDFFSSRAGQSPSTSLKRKTFESFDPCGDMYLWKPVELDISESARTNKEETTVEGKSSGLVGNGVGCRDRKKEPHQERASNSFFNNAVKYHISPGDYESNVQSKGRNFLGNLNEPFQFLSSSFSGKSSCHLSCRADELEKRILTDNVSSGFFLSKEKSQNSTPAINGRSFLNRPPPSFDGYGKELKSHGFKFSADLSLHVEHKTECRKKRKIFGVEIAEEVDESSLLSSDANNSYRKSDGLESDTSPFHSRGAFTGSLSKKASSPQGSQDAEDKKGDHVIERRAGFPSSEGISKADAIDILLTHAVSNECPTQLSANLSAPHKSLSYFKSGLRNQIDLNLSIDEAEAPESAILPSAVVKIIKPEIDLEVPALIESEVEHGGTNCRAKSEEHHQFQIKEAAGALIVISSALSDDVASYTNCDLENTANCLHLLADVICTYTSDEACVIREISQTTDGCDEAAVPEGMDYFEFETLQLKDAKEETYCYSLSDTEQRKDEEMEITATKRSGRGHKRRGRQQKDFQKDVLPGLVSLAKQEVVEDLHTIEEMFLSSGKTWKSSLSRRINAKKGRQWMKSGESLHTPEANSVCLPSKQKQTGKELQLRGKNFSGWGKRTRRLPRQRCSKKPCSSIQL